jgi:hypothetical protein
VPSIQAVTEKYLQNSIRAYLDGQPGCDLGWIIGVIGGAKEQARIIMETRFSQYAGTQAYLDLMAEL